MSKPEVVKYTDDYTSRRALSTTRRMMTISTITTKDHVEIIITERSLNITVIRFNLPDTSSRKRTTNEQIIDIELAHDNMQIRMLNTDDEYVVWEAIEKAITERRDSATHDIEGFRTLIRNNLTFHYNTKSRKKYLKHEKHPVTIQCNDYVMEDASDECVDFAGAVALKASIINDNRTNIFSSTYHTGKLWVNNSEVEFNVFMKKQLKDMDMSLTPFGISEIDHAFQSVAPWHDKHRDEGDPFDEF